MTASPSLEALIGSTVGEKYELHRLLGVGGMGAVYEALNRWTGRKVALKLMLPSHAQHPEQVERFLREARAASKIQHPSIVQVLDVGRETDGSFFLIQELLDGRPLKSLLDERTQLSPKETRALLLPVLEGLAEAHRNGVVHRDLKPDNLFVIERAGAAPIVKIIDFGIAKLTEHDGESVSVTRTGTAIGTPLYMSPEQARGERSVGPQTDVWSMGVVLFECLSGRCPFLGESYNEVLAKILTQRAPRLDRLAPGTPSTVCDVVAKALEPGRQERFATMGSFASALRECADFAIDRVFTAISAADPRSNDDPSEPATSGAAAIHDAATLDARAPKSTNAPDAERSNDARPSTAVFEDAPLERDATLAGTVDARAPSPTPSPAQPSVAATMSGVVVETPSAKKKPATPSLAIAAAVGLFVAGGGAALVARGRTQPQVPPVVSAPTRASQPTQHTESTGPARSDLREQPMAQPFAAAVSTDPPNAVIEIDGRVVGVGAFAGNFLANGAQHTLRVRADGYQPTVIEFRDSPPPPRVALVRIPGAARPTTARPRTGSPATPANSQTNATQSTSRGPMQRAYE
ncbi:MAG: protein kinase [Myxococcales bacterium]|nr:protein kinase [Myxococcales bacterium]